MRFSTKTRYGLRAMIEIARNENSDNDGIFQKEIANNQHISIKYLDQIIHALKAAGLISNVRGKKSGYRLTRKPSEITAYDVHNAFENGICVTDCLSENVKCEFEDLCDTQHFWNQLNQIIIQYFKGVTIEDLANNPDKIDI